MILIIWNINYWIPVHTLYINICEEGLAFCVFRRHIQLSSPFMILPWYIGYLRISFLYLLFAFTHFDMASVVCILQLIVELFLFIVNVPFKETFLMGFWISMIILGIYKSFFEMLRYSWYILQYIQTFFILQNASQLLLRQLCLIAKYWSLL